jgi:hypothetical protein
MERALELLEELADVVEAETCSESSQVAHSGRKRLPRRARGPRLLTCLESGIVSAHVAPIRKRGTSTASPISRSPAGEHNM